MKGAERVPDSSNWVSFRHRNENMRATVTSRVVEGGGNDNHFRVDQGGIDSLQVDFGGLWEVLEKAKVRQEYAAVIEHADRRYSCVY